MHVRTGSPDEPGAGAGTGGRGLTTTGESSHRERPGRTGGKIDPVSTLQCAATLLLAHPGAPERLAAAVRGRRVARVWADGDVGDDVAGRLSVGVTALPSAGTDVGAVLDEIADAHPGETVLVLAPEVLVQELPRTCRMRVPVAPLPPGETVEVLADADGRVCVRWG